MNRRWLHLVLCLVTWWMPWQAVGAETPPRVSRNMLETVRRMAIQHNGRNKPFDSFARETLQLITGSPQVGGEDPVATVLSIIADPERWQALPLISVPFIPLREALGFNRKTAHVSYNQLVETRTLMRMLPAIVQKQQRDEKLSILDNETMDAFQRFTTLSALFEHRLALAPPPPGSADPTWRSILQPEGYAPQEQEMLHGVWEHFISALRTGDRQAATVTATQLGETLRRANPSAYPRPWRLSLEVWYNAAAPFRLARGFYLLAVLALLLSLTINASWATRVGFGALGVAYGLHGAGIVMRVVLGGRPPVSNFFETMLWLPFVAVTLAVIFERIYRVNYIGLAGAVLAGILLLLADYLPLDSSISPVVAVLHSNLWLTVHVLTIVASYGALALATVLAHIYGVLYVRGRSQPSLPGLGTFLYRTIQVGVVLLAAGIMLGAVWANASWGRYWGWDPKETWALITLLWFLAVLHGRSAEWITGIGVALATIGGFFLLLMTYYGVSFYLVGLHSYAGGHAKPLPLLLIAYVIAELAFIAVLSFSALSRRRAA